MHKNTIKKIAVLLVVVGLIIALRFSSLGQQLTLGNLQDHGDQLRQYSNEHYVISVITFILIYIIATGLSLPGALILTLAAGYIYKTLLGAVYVNIGATAGATFAFIIARYIAGDWLQNKYSDKLARFNNELKQNGSKYLLVLRLVPIFPFFLINILAGITRIDLKTFVWTTSVGILPGSLVYAYAGEQLGTIRNVKDIFTTRILIAFLLLAALAILPVIIQKLRHKQN